MLITKILSAIIVIILIMSINSNATHSINFKGLMNLENLVFIKRFKSFHHNFYINSIVIATSNAIYKFNVKFVYSQFDT